MHFTAWSNRVLAPSKSQKFGADYLLLQLIFVLFIALHPKNKAKSWYPCNDVCITQQARWQCWVTRLASYRNIEKLAEWPNFISRKLGNIQSSHPGVLGGWVGICAGKGVEDSKAALGWAEHCPLYWDDCDMWSSFPCNELLKHAFSNYQLHFLLNHTAHILILYLPKHASSSD